MEITLKVKRAVVLLTHSTDQVSLELEDTPTTFPIMQYTPFVRIDVQAGYGAEWCRTVLGLESEVINTVSKRKI